MQQMNNSDDKRMSLQGVSSQAWPGSWVGEGPVQEGC